MAADGRSAEMFAQLQQAFGLRSGLGEGQQQGVAGPACLAAREAGHGAGAEAGDDMIADLAAVVPLQGQVEALLADAGVKARQFFMLRCLARQQGMAWEGDEAVQVGREALRELRHARQAGQHDPCFGQGGAQRTQGGRRAQHVAELKGAEHDDAAHAVPLQKSAAFHDDAVPHPVRAVASLMPAAPARGAW